MQRKNPDKKTTAVTHYLVLCIQSSISIDR